MRVYIPCDCEGEDTEHEIEVTPEGRGYYGPVEGDQLPCGRTLTSEDVDRIFETISDSHDYDP